MAHNEKHWQAKCGACGWTGSSKDCFSIRPAVIAGYDDLQCPSCLCTSIDEADGDEAPGITHHPDAVAALDAYPAKTAYILYRDGSAESLAAELQRLEVEHSPVGVHAGLQKRGVVVTTHLVRDIMERDGI